MISDSQTFADFDKIKKFYNYAKQRFMIDSAKFYLAPDRDLDYKLSFMGEIGFENEIDYTVFKNDLELV